LTLTTQNPTLIPNSLAIFHVSVHILKISMTQTMIRIVPKFLIAILCSSAMPVVGHHQAPPGLGTHREILDLPMHFEANMGQAKPEIDFVARGTSYDAYLDAGGTRVTMRSSSDEGAFGFVLLGADTHRNGSLQHKLLGVSNYLFGSNPDRWITHLEHYARVRYNDIYRGIDVIYYGNESCLEHDFVVHPASTPGKSNLKLRTDRA
jgi:hypothetical protein